MKKNPITLTSPSLPALHLGASAAAIATATGVLLSQTTSLSQLGKITMLGGLACSVIFLVYQLYKFTNSNKALRIACKALEIKNEALKVPQKNAQARQHAEVQRKRVQNAASLKRGNLTPKAPNDQGGSHPQSAETTVSRLLTKCLIIDTNLWLDPAYDSLFDRLAAVCQSQKRRFAISGVQFDEISNIKKQATYGTSQSHRSRLALSRIETLQNQGALTIIGVTTERNPVAYTDEAILHTLGHQSRQGRACTLLTLDRELRLRARQILRDESQKSIRWSVPDPSDILKITDEAQGERDAAA